MAVSIRVDMKGNEYVTFKGIKTLKPCPFCGGTDLRVTSKDIFESCFKERGIATICLECKTCSVEMYEHNYRGRGYATKVKHLVDKWNERKGE